MRTNTCAHPSLFLLQNLSDRYQIFSVPNRQDMSDTETAEEKGDVRSSTSTLRDEEEERRGYVDLGKNKSEALDAHATSSSRLRLVVWMVVNTLATIGIVSLLPEPRLLPQMLMTRLS